MSGQVALAFVLLMSGGLLLASLANMLRADPGFEREDRFLVRTARLVRGLTKYNNAEDHIRLFGRIEEAVRAVPGVVAIEHTDNPPLSGRESRADFSPADRPLIPPATRRIAEWMRVSTG